MKMCFLELLQRRIEKSVGNKMGDAFRLFDFVSDR